ncbi:recombinase family protein [Prauserella flavalba]|uniref:recombinase family protein n=1 Tax=Prauserella flavalba TaxID=1477506 RepID=UPI0036E127C8
MRNTHDDDPGRPSWLERLRHKLDEADIADMQMRLDQPPRQVRTYHQALARRSQLVLMQRVREGQWLGAAPYGYRRVSQTAGDDSAGREQRYRLVVDHSRAHTVPVIFDWYVDQRMGISGIAARLAGDVDRYPAPLDQRTGRQRYWTVYTVRTILTNPAYLGYAVWRRRWHGRVQAREHWIWSDGPSHPALVDPDLFWTAYDLASRPPWLTAALARTR